MANNSERTEELSKSSLDLSKPPLEKSALLRCVDTSVLRGPGGREIKLGASELSIGRGSENAVIVDGTGISRIHARVYFADQSWHVEDLGSTNGTRVNNSNVNEASLADGDTVAFGRVCYKFVTLEPSTGPRQLDLGADRTLILAPHERPGGAPSEERPAPAARPPPVARRAPARRESGSGLGIWVVLVLVALVAVLAGMIFLS